MTDALARSVRAHLDRSHGSPFWIDRARARGVGPDDLRTLDDLRALGPLDLAELRERPLDDLVPRSLAPRRSEWIVAETGGTTGRPIRSVYLPEEFEQAFGRPFTIAARARSFPIGGTWLYLGPSGPHVIGQAARLLARGLGAAEPFAVDLDPRWARAQEPGSLGERLYRGHLLDQALDVLAREAVDVLFATPPLALDLALAMAAADRAAIRGIHLGGMALAADAYRSILEAFPEAVVVPGYGNSMFGLMAEVVAPGPEMAVDYFHRPGRLVVRVVDDAGREVEPGATGRVEWTRLDVSCLLPGVVERDEAVRVLAPPAVRELGYAASGVRDPRPVAASPGGRGVY